MRLLKAIFQNALILATLVIMGAGAILVSYADRDAVEARKGTGSSLKADEGVPPNLIAATTTRRVAPSEADEGKPPGMGS